MASERIAAFRRRVTGVSYFSSAVVIDVECTGLVFQTDDLIQIGAIESKSPDSEVFNIYINPERHHSITAEVQNITGISKKNGKMYKDLVEVESVPLAEALKRFLQYLKRFPQPVMLVAHNAVFDANFLVDSFKRCSMLDEFLAVVAGFTDTFEAALKNVRKSSGLQNYQLKSLVYHFTRVRPTDLHSATADALALKKVLPYLLQTDEKMKSFSYSMEKFSKIYDK
jgi:DNA polymerase III alpha subunit (gram-positive type)